VPVEDVDPDDLSDDFDDLRSGSRTHQALDILAARGSPVLAVEDGTIASLDPSQGGGGIVVYQFDPTGEFVYYYAHLEGFADGLAEGQTVEKGDVLGFVGTSGNAPPGTPHLHFAITKTWAPFLHYGGTPINPFEVLR
jgi:murein DD-endopeptidase MepM/ murein hydrolase activator NlpD